MKPQKKKMKMTPPKKIMKMKAKIKKMKLQPKQLAKADFFNNFII